MVTPAKTAGRRSFFCRTQQPAAKLAANRSWKVGLLLAGSAFPSGVPRRRSGNEVPSEFRFGSLWNRAKALISTYQEKLNSVSSPEAETVSEASELLSDAIDKMSAVMDDERKEREAVDRDPALAFPLDTKHG